MRVFDLDALDALDAALGTVVVDAMRSALVFLSLRRGVGDAQAGRGRAGPLCRARCRKSKLSE